MCVLCYCLGVMSFICCFSNLITCQIFFFLYSLFFVWLCFLQSGIYPPIRSAKCVYCVVARGRWAFFCFWEIYCVIIAMSGESVDYLSGKQNITVVIRLIIRIVYRRTLGKFHNNVLINYGLFCRGPIQVGCRKRSVNLLNILDLF